MLPVVVEEVPASEMSTDLEASDARVPFHRYADIGLGVNVGFTTGGKLRMAFALPPAGLERDRHNFLVGIDLDVGTGLILFDSTASLIVGYELHRDRVGAPRGRARAMRIYGTLGGGRSAVWAIFDVVRGGILHAGGGIELKTSRWFGIGLEGGANLFMGTGAIYGESTQAVVPFGRFTAGFYLQ